MLAAQAGSRRGRIGTEALLLSLAFDDGIGGRALAARGVEPADLLVAAEALAPDTNAGGTEPTFAPMTARALLTAVAYAGGAAVTTGHLLLGLLDEPDSVAVSILAALGVRTRALKRAVVTATEVHGVTDDERRSGSGEVVERVDLRVPHPAPLVWSLVHPVRNAPLLSESIVHGAVVSEADGVLIEEVRHRTPSGEVTHRYESVVEVPGRRERTRVLAPTDLLPTVAVNELTPMGEETHWRCELLMEGDYARWPLAASLIAGWSAQTRGRMHRARDLLDAGWMPGGPTPERPRDAR
ncbi:Clp protease N-terminal domain-containing protein [Agromyces allii]|uniref:Clp protease N-terminal domain-containing protein n=1 Tax=Agromyces allii TaxID=393607 RepID=UPI001478B815|nr:Clp protease N-terminal domain-containing protein [Agromyces allii]